MQKKISRFISALLLATLFCFILVSCDLFREIFAPPKSEEAFYTDLGDNGDGNGDPPTPSSRFVAVGDSGTVWWSETGDTWTEAESTPPGSPDLNRVRFVDDRLVAVGDGGTLWYSPDGGVNWTAVNTGTSHDLNAVAYGASAYVVAGEDGADGVTLTSTDGVNWNGPFSEAGFRFRALAFGGSTFFAICTNDWHTRNGSAVDVVADTWTVGEYDASGGRGHLTEYGASNYMIIFNNLGGSPQGRYSPTGATDSWSDGVLIGGAIIPAALRHNGSGRLVAVGGDGTVWYTDDEEAGWTHLLNTAGLGNDMQDVVHGGDRWVAVGLAGQAWISTTDIAVWITATSPPGFQHLRGVAYLP